MRIPTSLLDRIDVPAIVREELLSRNRFLPPDLVNYALHRNAPQVSDWLATTLRREIRPSRHDIILAKKAPRGSRPLPFMALEDRLLYRAVVSPLRDALPNSRVSIEYESFLKAPLEVDRCEYVLKADIAGFYQYIDHERLIDEVIAQTGDDLAVGAAVEFIQGSSGRRFGLPQMSQPSDTLADCYIDPIQRNLLRHEYPTFRYVDDFRVACTDYEHALGALELLERSAFSLGLILNDSKTLTPSVETYEQSLNTVKQAEEELFSRLEGTIEGFFLLTSGYGDQADDDRELLPWLPGLEDDEVDSAPGTAGAPNDVQVAAANHVLTMWDDDQRANVVWTSGTWAVLLRKAFAVLASDAADNGANHSMTVGLATNLLIYEPHLTHELVNYLTALGQAETDLVSKIVDEAAAKHVLSPWQLLWLAHLAGTLPISSRRTPRHVAWLQHEAEFGRHDAVAARAALALAQRQLLTVGEAHKTYERVESPHHRTVALALAAAEGRTRQQRTHDDLIDGFAASWVHSQKWGQSAARRRVVRKSKGV
ncbi:reverse transcriptase domain-containing protein [Georgenia yuyongxinii]|uniref:Reverse transcriptase domain-containing protein n=1 Tax=Georgenia yuyongxinii TaxID=2589797 RepID=A0A552WRU7_9MICO|nr:reverse transcriptase domain-containing protein [Georgenia yuyongxinii]TRW45309.1 hypothetical protein FJ693_10015 [Georgenia yuyongxinii]